jgi:hypothetical protein
MTDGSRLPTPRPTPGLGITPGALFVSLMADHRHEHPSRPVRASRRRVLSRFRWS